MHPAFDALARSMIPAILGRRGEYVESEWSARMTHKDANASGASESSRSTVKPLIALLELGEEQSGWDVGSVEKDAQGRLATFTFKHRITGETTTLAVPDVEIKPHSSGTASGDKRRRKRARWAR